MIISSITPTQQMKTTKKYAKKPYMMVEGDCFNTVPEREQDLVVVDRSILFCHRACERRSVSSPRLLVVMTTRRQFHSRPNRPSWSNLALAM